MEFYSAVAERLLKDGLLLTALELYTEFAERGKCLTSLKNFFEDSSNFEQFTRKTAAALDSPVPSTAGSQLTLDDGGSLDFARYSEDSVQHHSVQVADRVAVLEFELRKATQTINSLRSELTLQASSAVRRGSANEASTPPSQALPTGPAVSPNDCIGNGKAEQGVSEGIPGSEDDDSLDLLGHEKRTINYLVNEYLLSHGYKLTAITFSDENSDEDFEDWESIGLNMSKPPDLGRIFRGFNTCYKKVPLPHTDTSNQVMPPLQQPIKEETPQPIKHMADVSIQVDQLQQENQSLLKDLSQQLEVAKAANVDLKSQADEASAKVKQQEQTIVDLEKKVASLSDCDSNQLPENDTDDDSVPSLSDDKQKFETYLLNLQELPLNSDSPVSIMTNTFNDAIGLISTSMQEIIPHVLLAHRSTVLPLLLTAIKHHESSEERDKLLNLLFNLTKKPDDEMRAVIVTGFVEIALTNRSRIEAELLPQLWSQIEHKYSERRVLVSQTCRSLIRHIPSTIRDSLVFSMLQQLILQDREPDVKLAACDAMSVLILYIQDQEKLNATVPKLVNESLADPDIRERTLTGMMLSYAKCCKPNSLMEFVEASVISVSAYHLQTLNNLMPFVIQTVITDAPFHSSASNEEADPDDSSESLMNVLMPNFVNQTLPKLNECMTSFEIWPRLVWLIERVMDPLIELASNQTAGQPNNTVPTLQLVSIFNAFVTVFGKDPILKNIMDKMDSLPFESSLVPVYYLGVLSGSPEMPSQLQGAIVQASDAIPASTDGLAFTITYMLEEPEQKPPTICCEELKPSTDRSLLRDALCEMAWALVVSQSPNVRSFAGVILNILAASDRGDLDDLIGTKILPALVTLSSDPDFAVQKAAIPGIGRVICVGLGSGFYCMSGSGSSSRITNETREKAIFQLVSKISPQREGVEDSCLDKNHEVLLETATTIGKIVSYCNANTDDLNTMALRDEVMLPKLAAINELYTPPDISDAKCLEMASTLLTIYKIMLVGPDSTCVQRLPPQVYQATIHNSLIKLGRDFHRLGIVAQETSTLGLISQLDSNRTGAASIMTHSPSMEEVKSKVGKLFNRPTGSFWSKK